MNVDTSIQKAVSDVELVKNIITKTKLNVREISNFFIWTGLYFFIDMFIEFVQIIFVTKLVNEVILITELGKVILIVCFFIMFLHFKKIINHENDLSLFLIDIWGYTIVIVKIVSIITSVIQTTFNQINLSNIQYSSIGYIPVTVGICLLLTGLLIKSRLLTVLAGVFFSLICVGYFIPNITISLSGGMVLTYSCFNMFTTLLMFIVCICLKLYFTKQTFN